MSSYTSRDYALARIPQAEKDWLNALAKYGPDHSVTQDLFRRLNTLLDWLLPCEWPSRWFGDA